MIILLLLIVVIAVVGSYYQQRTKHRTRFGIKELSEKNANLIYADEKGAKTFKSSRFKINARPDFIFQLASGEQVLVEFKSRRTKLYDGDVKQLIATAITVKETYPNLKRGYVCNLSGQTRKIDLDLPLDVLARKIKNETIQLRAIKAKKEPIFSPVLAKCNACGMINHCNKRAI